MDKDNRFCPSCMRPLGEDGRCAVCGEVSSVENAEHQLPVGTLLAGRYLIGRVIGQGGFGITYVGRDMTLGMKVAVKEYFPSGDASRYHTVSCTVSSSLGDGSYERGLSRFIDEAQSLARFADDPNIVCVRDYFEANSTAYIVMEYLDGESLMASLSRRGRYSFAECLELLKPVMRALARMHEEGIIHRDISPSNLMLMKDGRVKLLDFGTARQVNEDGERSVSVMLKPGFAPIEQYRSHGSQGSWTDVYAMCASIYKLITGTTPVNAMDRMFDDTLALPSSLGAAISAEQEAALMRGLALDPAARIQTMSGLASALGEASSDPSSDPTSDPALGAAVTPVRVDDKDSEKTVSSVSELKAQSGVESGGDEELTSSGIEILRDPAPGVFGDTPAPDASSVSGAGPSAPDDAAPLKRRAKKRGGEVDASKKTVRLIAALIALVAIAAGVLIYFFGSNGDDDDGSYFSSQEISVWTLRKSKRNKVTSISFFDCSISDDAIAFIPSIKSLNYRLSFDKCSGFTSLDPIAESSASSLELWGRYDLNGNYDAFDVSLFGTDFENITSLTLYYYDVSDSSFLSHFPALKSLKISNCTGTVDLGELTAYGIESISLGGVGVKDFSALSAFRSLKGASLEEMGMTDLDWAAGLDSITELYVSGNQLKNLDGLKGHGALTTLKASKNRISDISGLEGCTALRDLSLSDNLISDIGALGALGRLRDVDLSGNRIRDIGPLAGCVEITALRLSSNEIEDASPLTACTAMKYLAISNNEIGDLDFCYYMIDLSSIYAENCGLANIEGLVNTTQLEELVLNGNSVTDISPAAKNAPKLLTVLLRGNGISDFSALRGCTELTLLAIDDNYAEDLDFLADSNKLAALCAGNNRISDISALNCPFLKYTDLGDNQISDISALSVCSAKDQVLLLHNNNISDLAPLSSGASFRLLSLYGNPIGDFTPLLSVENEFDLSCHLYLSWSEGLDFDPVAKYDGRNLHIVETPLDAQAVVREDIKTIRRESGIYSSDPAFISGMQADEDMDNIRAQARDQEIKRSIQVKIDNL